MSESLFRLLKRRAQGVALVIVLGFIVLLTGLVVAFFSRAMSERQISNSSADQVKADLFAQGAVDTIIGDLRQEMAAGSTITTLPTGGTILTPKTPQAAVPAVAGVTTNSGGLNNLVKRSGYQQPFYANATGATTYDTTNYPPPGSASDPLATRSRAAGPSTQSSSQMAALNGRYISPDRWNKALLLAKQTPTAEGTTPTTEFVSPDWVLVARNGMNPTAWNSNMVASNSSPTSVVGRYAYNVYDEGGLLDANVAGYPTGTDGKPDMGVAFKSALAFADLTQVPGISDLTPTSQRPAAVVNSLVGWRNYASSQANGSGNVANGFTFSAAMLTNFTAAITGNTNGFLQSGNVPMTTDKQSDRNFAGRQELMKLLLQGIATNSAERANLQNALQYLGTFSRGLNQPSFIKTQSTDSTALGYDATAPKVLDPAAGGNNAVGLDSAINPSFLTVRVKTTTAHGRFDGSDLMAGEPLVKKRFSLNRLAWLSYAGPITSDGINYNSGLDPQYISTLKQTYGFTDAFLLQGTGANIQKSFGLTWSNGLWSYNIHNRDGTKGPIRKLDFPSDSNDVARASPGREPDFFELLKASISVGSIGKTGTPSSTVSGQLNPTGIQVDQYNTDYNVDDAIIQIGANIIDQFDLDNYPTRIAYDDGTGGLPRDPICGVENLPYISRILNAFVKVKQYTTSTSAGVTTITNTGVGALLQCPELWNPHDYNPNNLDQTAGRGTAGPTKFRVYATTGTNSTNQIITLVGVNNGNVTQSSAVATDSPGYQGMYGFSYAVPEQRTLSQTNTELDFTIPKTQAGSTQFREPTILVQSASVDTSPAPSSLGTIGGDAGFFVNNAFRSDVGDTAGAPIPLVGAGYVGFYIGAVPLYWKYTANDWTVRVKLLAPVDFHYFLQYQDAGGNWVTYDEKNQTLQNELSNGGHSSPGANGWWSFLYSRPGLAYDSSSFVLDPRSSRFNLLKCTILSNNRWWAYPPYEADSANRAAVATGCPGEAAISAGWLNVSKGITVSMRSGTYAGTAFACSSAYFPSAMGWYPGSPSFSGGGTNVTHMFRVGLLSQNNPLAKHDTVPLGDYGDSGSYPYIGPGSGASPASQYYADADGVVRRAMGGLVSVDSTNTVAATSDTGLPMAIANSGGGTTRTSQSDSRPVILNRPFRSVGELGYTFAGTPWKTLNFTMPESGDSALLDVFCLNETDDANGLVAGKVNLNTRQAPVLQAIVAGACKDQWNVGTSTVAGGNNSVAAKVATTLVTRTSSTASGKGPLQNVSELVGRWVQANRTTGSVPTGIQAPFDPSSYDGFSADLWNGQAGVLKPTNLMSTSDTTVLAQQTDAFVGRYQAAAVRALANCGQTRVWNLMIDVVAQTGRYPQTAANSSSPLAAFSVEGEQRYWVHVAIDRLTGQVIDKQIEVVKE